MNLTTTSMDLKDDQPRTKKIKLNEFTVREGILSYKSITVGYKYNFNCYSILSLLFRSLPHERSLTLYSSLQIILILYLLVSKPLLEYLSHQTPSLALCELWWPVQGSSLYKCSQKSSCNAFNAVVATFP